MEEARPVCAEEALNVLNCVTESPYQEEKCLRLLNALRECVLNRWERAVKQVIDEIAIGNGSIEERDPRDGLQSGLQKAYDGISGALVKISKRANRTGRSFFLKDKKVKKFSLAEQNQPETSTNTKEKQEENPAKK